jgi:hypothetical protein
MYLIMFLSFVLLGALAPVAIFHRDKFLRFFPFYAASNLASKIRIKRSPRPPPRRALMTRIAFCALYIRKFEPFLSLKGRAAAAAVQPPPHLLRSPARLWRGLRPQKLLKNAGSNCPAFGGTKRKTQKF